MTSRALGSCTGHRVGDREPLGAQLSLLTVRLQGGWGSWGVLGEVLCLRAGAQSVGPDATGLISVQCPGQWLALGTAIGQPQPLCAGEAPGCGVTLV